MCSFVDCTVNLNETPLHMWKGEHLSLNVQLTVHFYLVGGLSSNLSKLATLSKMLLLCLGPVRNQGAFLSLRSTYYGIVSSTFHPHFVAHINCNEETIQGALKLHYVDQLTDFLCHINEINQIKKIYQQMPECSFLLTCFVHIKLWTVQAENFIFWSVHVI